MEWLTAWFSSVWTSFERWGKSLLLTLWDMVTDMFYLILDLVSGATASILAGLSNSFENMDMLPAFTFLSPEMANILGLIGVGQAISMIIASIGVRLVLQLIPFTRLGS
jgi:hypothetical protein